MRQGLKHCLSHIRCIGGIQKKYICLQGGWQLLQRLGKGCRDKCHLSCHSTVTNIRLEDGKRPTVMLDKIHCPRAMTEGLEPDTPCPSKKVYEDTTRGVLSQHIKQRLSHQSAGRTHLEPCDGAEPTSMSAPATYTHAWRPHLQHGTGHKIGYLRHSL
jgi:hypothetical protein